MLISFKFYGFQQKRPKPWRINSWVTREFNNFNPGKPLRGWLGGHKKYHFRI